MKSQTLSLKIGLIFFFAWLIIPEGHAQETGTIKGKIIEQITKQPIAGATVFVKNTQEGAVTDSGGLFTINNISDGSYSLVISNVGFQQKVLNDVYVVKAKTYYLETELMED